jgi:cytochrome bd ubiquinol oxidase subunit II
MIDWHTVQTVFMAVVVIAAVGAYVVLDGFDLGIGMLSSFAIDSAERDQMANVISPFWDGNETWLVFGSAVLLAMFPIAFAVILPALYMPLIVMLLALIFRGVAFEFRVRHDPRLRTWDLAFAAGSVIATFAQGMVLGTFLQGIPVLNGHFAGSQWAWLSPFSVVTGVALVVGYGLLGATFLFWRASGVLQENAGTWARPLLYGLLVFIVVVSIWTPLLLPSITARWFDFPLNLAFAPVPILTVLCALQVMRKLEPRKQSMWPFACSIGVFFLCFTGLAISIFPLMPPPSLSLFDTASSSSAQRFLLPGIVVIVPVIIVRTWINYRLFARHGDDDDGYGVS